MKQFTLFMVLVFSIMCSYGNAFFFQEAYRSHNVRSGETVYSISETYNVTEAVIYKLNPDAKKGITTGSVLILPAQSFQITTLAFKEHKVKRKQTLYSISKQYGVTQDDIKKYNKHLYARALKKGEKLKIPVFPAVSKPKENPVSSVLEKPTPVKQEFTTHTIKHKETKYGIARKYGISIVELEKLNPNLPNNFPVGSVLKVPAISVTDSATIQEDNFGFYEVLPKEGFFRLKIKLGLSQEEIVALNPYASEGLKEGMILKIPKKSDSLGIGEIPKINLENTVTNLESKHLVVMLPFQLKDMNVDSLMANKKLVKANRTMRIALDFYSGVLMASQFANDKGIPIALEVYDTEGNKEKVDEILHQNNFKNADAVIGPLLSKNVQYAANFLQKENVPVFSPLSNRSITLVPNLFQTLPDNKLLEASMIKYLKENSQDKKVLLIIDKEQELKKTIITSSISDVTIVEPRDKGFLYAVDIQEKMEKDKDNWIILESDDPITVSNVVSLLNSVPEPFKVRLFTTHMGKAYDYEDVSNMHLANLSFTFPSINRSYNFDDENPFLKRYEEAYGVLPNRFAVRGFEIAYDIFLRLAYTGNLYDASANNLETEYLENKFRYKKKMLSGYRNNAFYILKYNKNLQFDIVK